LLKTSKTGSKISAQRGSEVRDASPHQGQGYIFGSSQQNGSVSPIPSAQRRSRSEAAHQSMSRSPSDFPRSLSPKPGPSVSPASTPRGTESRSRTEGSRHSSPHRKVQQTQTTPSFSISMHRNVSPVREEATRKSSEAKQMRNEVSHRASSALDAKYFRQLSFLDQKDNSQSQILQEDPPSKVQKPQGVRVPRRISVYPKDEAVQTEPIRRITAEVRSSRSPPAPEHGSSRVSAEPRGLQKKIAREEPEMGPRSSVLPDSRAVQKNMHLELPHKFSTIRELDSGHRVSVRPDPESSRKHSAYPETKYSPKFLISEVESNMKSPTRGDSDIGRRVTISELQPTQRGTAPSMSQSSRKSSAFVSSEPTYKQQTPKPTETTYMSSGPALRYPEPSRKPYSHPEVELTPRPLPPRSLPRYEPDSSWWYLLNPQVETPQSQPTTPDLEPKSPPPLDPLLTFLKMDSQPFCEDCMFQREKASPPPPPTPKDFPSQASSLREVPQATKYTSKQPIQRFSAFFLDVSEEMYNRVIWWLKGLCFSLLWAHSGGLGGIQVKGWNLCICRSRSFRR
uniref:Septin 4 n=1 Tax=Otolemur garnettii TaxID=30611 RepID=H0Y213_OTOGA